MTNTALYWDGSAWQLVGALQGPQGPPGPLASGPPTGAATGDLQGTYPAPGITNSRVGGLLAVQRGWGAIQGYRAIAQNQKYFFDAGVNPCQVSYTPLVECWWEVEFHSGIMQKLDAAYTHSFSHIKLTPADVNGVDDALCMDVQHSAVQQFAYHHVCRTFHLAANTAYTAYSWFDQLAAAGSWQYHQGQQYLYMRGAAWAA